MAELSIALQVEAGASLRLVKRRRSVRLRWQRAYTAARARGEASRVEDLDAGDGLRAGRDRVR
ncbi:MAG: hypothetical protein ACRDT0_03995 [Pseudonocardiaceae bacterium]